MKALRFATVTLLTAGALARAAEQETPRRPRMPADYNARVHLHAPPAMLGEPRKPPLVTPDQELAPADASAGPDIPRRAPPMMLPINPDLPDMPDQERSIPRARDVFDWGDKSTDPKTGARGWGWLADEIATNRARRTARDTESESDGSTNSYAREEGWTNQQEAARNERATTSFNNSESERRQTVIEPAVGWVIDARVDPRSRAEPAPELDMRLDPSLDVTLSARADWTRLDAPLRAPAETQDRMAVGADNAVEEPRRATEPARWILGGDPWSADKVKSGADWQTVAPGGSVGWQSAAFSPLSITPQEPVSVAPTPVAPPLSLSPSSSDARPSLGGMGSERDRATPKTLPW